jgi:hypothetical protein
MKIAQFALALLFIGLAGMLFAQTDCPNRCLRFDGVNDFVQISPSPVQGNANFTLEGWFLSEDSDGIPGTSCSGNFERIAGFGNTRFEIGECGGIFSFYSNPTGIVQSGVNTLDGQWHHFAVVKNGNNVKIYLDGSPAIDVTAAGHSLGSTFRIGHWVATAFSDQTWEGKLDEFRLWNFARSLEEILATKDCPLQGNEPGLVGYYNFNQGIAEGNNPGETVLPDLSPSANHGTLNNFALTGANSNWVCSEAPVECQDSCTANLVLNGNFQEGLAPGDLNGAGNVNNWSPIPSGSGGSGLSSPQVIANDGCTENGAMRMWGNQVVGEGVRQNISFTAGQTYQLSFCGKYTPTVQPNARLRFRATNNPNLIYNYGGGYLPCNLPDCEEIYLSPILTTGWNTYTAPEWTPQNNYTNLVVTVWNDFAVDNGEFVSWAQVDDICIQLVEQTACTGSILKNGDFQTGLAPGDLNGAGNVDDWSPIPSGSGGSGLSSPQVIANDGCAENGAMRMWGNQVVGEGIRQEVAIDGTKVYRLSFCGKFTPTVQPNARLRFRATNNPNLIYNYGGGYLPCNLPDCEEIYLSPILTTGWVTYTKDWTPQNDYTNLVVTVSNDFDVDNGEFVSWAQVDDICLVITSSASEWKETVRGSVFPNPSDGELSIRFPDHQINNGSLHIMDIWGRSMQAIPLPSGVSEYDFSIAALSPGVYILVLIENGQPVWRERVVKR